MTKPINPYCGAYSRRRYSNLSTASGTFGTATQNPGGGSNAGYTLTAYAADPTMGRVVAVNVSEVVNEPVNTGLDFATANAKRYAAGTVVEVQAKGNTGYRFVSWATNIPGTSQSQRNPLRVTMNRDITLIANFERVNVSYTLNVRWDETMGRVNASGSGLTNGSLSATPGSQVSLEATPKDGYVFKRWEGVNLAGNRQNNTSRRITLTMPARDLSLTAVFVKATETPGGGGGTPSGGTSDEHQVQEIIIDNVIHTQGSSLLDQVVPFVKKWWWAILIGAWLWYDKKGGSK